MPRPASHRCGHFNVTERENGDTRALQPPRVVLSQQYATRFIEQNRAVIEATGTRNRVEPKRGTGDQGRYPGASWKRAADAGEIKEHLKRRGCPWGRSGEIAAHRTRDAKIDVSHEEMQRWHKRWSKNSGTNRSVSSTSTGPCSPDRAEEQGANRQNSRGGGPRRGRKEL